MVARQPSLVVEDDSWLDKTLREEEKWKNGFTLKQSQCQCAELSRYLMLVRNKNCTSLIRDTTLRKPRESYDCIQSYLPAIRIYLTVADIKSRHD
jgi:hypothetical protein